MRLGDFDALKETIINFCGKCSNNITEYDENHIPNGNCAIWHILNMIDNAPTVVPEMDEFHQAIRKCLADIEEWKKKNEKRPQGDLISREALKKALDDRMINFEDICRDSVFNIIDDTPTVDINKEVWNQSNTLLEKRLTYLKRPQGEWIELRKYDYKCSICGQSMMDKWNYCPNCGADMRVKEELKEKEG